MTTAALPAWLPSTAPHEHPCGRDFDAVRLRSFDGTRLLGKLRERSGPVVEDQGVMVWLVPPGAARGWEFQGVTVLGAGSVLTVPPARAVCDGQPHWLLPPRGDCLTEPRALLEALAETMRGVWRVRCTRCWAPKMMTAAELAEHDLRCPERDQATRPGVAQ